MLTKADQEAVDRAIRVIRETANDFPKLVLYFADVAARMQRLPREAGDQEKQTFDVLLGFLDLQLDFLNLLEQSTEADPPPGPLARLWLTAQDRFGRRKDDDSV